MNQRSRDVRDDDLLAPEAIADPYPLLSTLRETAPVHYSERFGSWFITRYEDVSDGFRDPRFSSDRISGFIERKLDDADAYGSLRRTFEVLARWLVFKDPPSHTRLRRLVHRAFTPRAVESMRARIQEISDGLLADIHPAGEADLVGSFAFPIPAIVIAEMLGVPPKDRDRFKTWSDQLTPLVFGNFEDPHRYRRASAGMAELCDYLDGLVSQAEDVPGEDLIGALVRARDEGDALSHEEVIATCILLLFGGHETTTNLIASGIFHLATNRDQFEAVRNGDVDPRSMVEEVIRFDGPAKTVVRQLHEDVDLHGHRLEAGQRVFLVPAAANRDPRVFSRPDEFDVGRSDSSKHVGFGIGIHYCLGAPLARLEASIAIPAIVRRLEGLTVVRERVTWHPVLLSRGPETLPVRFQPSGS